MNTIPHLIPIPFAFPGLPNIDCIFGTRVGGVSFDPFDRANISLDVGDDPARAAGNRSSLMKSLGFATWNELKQVHGAEMAFDFDPTPMDEPGSLEADGLASDKAGQALVIKTADCQPILLAHTGGKQVAALHAGWRGNVQKFPTLGVQAFADHYNLNPADIMAVRGPSLGPAASVFENFDQEFGPEFKDYYNPETKTVDLWTLTRDQLTQAGIKPQNIFSLDLCTKSLPELFFSYRLHNRTGRQASIIWIKR